MSQYLIDHEKLRLRAERGEGQARRWRATAYVLLVLLVAQTWLAVDTAISLTQARQSFAEFEDELYLYSEQARNEANARDVAEQKFRTCLSANAGLVDALREFDLVVKGQQQVIRETLELAKRCDAQPAQWVTADAR